MYPLDPIWTDDETPRKGARAIWVAGIAAAAVGLAAVVIAI